MRITVKAMNEFIQRMEPHLTIQISSNDLYLVKQDTNILLPDVASCGVTVTSGCVSVANSFMNSY